MANWDTLSAWLTLKNQEIHQLHRSARLLFLFILGALLAGVAELPFGGWLQIPLLSGVWYLLSLDKDSPLKRHLLPGVLFGLGYFTLGLWWIYITLHDVGGMNAVLSCAAVFLLAGFLALFFAGACLAIPLFKRAPQTGLLLAACWTLIEYLRGTIFTGFPWMGLAEAQVHGPFAPLAPYLGGLGCTFFVIWLSWLALSLRNHGKRSAALIVCLLGFSQLLNLWTFTKPTGEPLSVELLQGNFAQSLVFKPEGMLRQIEFYKNAMIQSHTDLVVAPETALPWPEPNLPTGTLEALQDFSTTHQSFLLFGVIGRHFNPADGREFSNRALGLSPNNPPYRYDKSHLVPFGEFIPPGFRWFVEAFSVPLSDFARGRTDQPFFLINRNTQVPLYAAITICYEDVFGGELASRLRDSSEPANLLINITNLAWFGASQAPAQQLRLSQLRSLETGLPSIRATNTGITAALGADGKVLGQLPQFTQGILSAQVQAYSGKTPYVLWGNIPILTISCLVLILGIIRQKRFK
ncbi:apolipoprotein N-acyltransferase [Polynucleobacter meluiroseus]|uniref:apolipoprotein N-acyltransferase n=1 Tax=Polynucleobacter meluiroseus TaxID=1938814 RepID=UPI001FAE79B1|nr:apolipoprotein N-acyltransferase [Polynucleobacter meluiroseus]